MFVRKGSWQQIPMARFAALALALVRLAALTVSSSDSATDVSQRVYRADAVNSMYLSSSNKMCFEGVASLVSCMLFCWIISYHLSIVDWNSPQGYNVCTIKFFAGGRLL